MAAGNSLIPGRLHATIWWLRARNAITTITCMTNDRARLDRKRVKYKIKQGGSGRPKGANEQDPVKRDLPYGP